MEVEDDVPLMRRCKGLTVFLDTSVYASSVDFLEDMAADPPVLLIHGTTPTGVRGIVAHGMQTLTDWMTTRSAVPMGFGAFYLLPLVALSVFFCAVDHSLRRLGLKPGRGTRAYVIFF